MRLTADDVLDIPVPDQLRGYELENGELVEVSLPSPPHGRIVALVAHHLLNHVEERGGRGSVYGEVGCVLALRHDPERLRGPDVSYVSEEALRAHGGEPAKGWFRLIPDLVVEVDSPGRKPAIEQRRIQEYLDAGVRLLWVIHTDARSATMYLPDGSARLLRVSEALEGEPVLPGLRLPLTRLFPEAS
jgi:Uma2 family endonuclease